MNRLLALVALACALPAAAQPDGLPPSWTEPTEPFEIFDGVYWVGTQGLAAYLFTTPEGHILLDVGMPENADAVQASIRTLGFEAEDVRYLLNSHAHFDHSGGLARLKEISGAQMVASAGDRPALEQGVYPGWESRTDLNFPPVQVDRVIEDGQTVSLGDVALTAHVTPGHSAGCTSWSFTARDQGRDYQALVFCSGSVALNRLAPNPQYPGIVDAYRDTFRRVRALEVDAYLAPHPEQFGLAEKLARRQAGGANPFIDPAEKDRRIAEFEQAFEQALAAQQTSGAAAGGAAADSAAADVQRQVFDTERAFARSMADRDHAAFTALLADEAIFFAGDKPLRGREAVAEAWKPFFDGADAPFSWEPDQVAVLESGSLALSTGPVYDPAGQVTARFQSIWRREADGSWRIVFDRGTPACPPSPSPSPSPSP